MQKVGAVVDEGDGFVTRRMTLVEGRLRRASPAELSQNVYPDDPYLAFGIRYREVEYTRAAWRHCSLAIRWRR